MKFYLSLVLILGSFTAFFAHGQTKKKTEETKNKFTQEDRHNMAAMHEKMAQCLRSAKPLSECDMQSIKCLAMIKHKNK